MKRTLGAEAGAARAVTDAAAATVQRSEVMNLVTLRGFEVIERSLRELAQPFQMSLFQIAVDFGVLRGDIVLLAEIGGEVVERELRGFGFLCGAIEAAVVIGDFADHLPITVERADIAVGIPE